MRSASRDAFDNRLRWRLCPSCVGVRPSTSVCTSADAAISLRAGQLRFDAAYSASNETRSVSVPTSMAPCSVATRRQRPDGLAGAAQRLRADSGPRGRFASRRAGQTGSGHFVEVGDQRRNCGSRVGGILSGRRGLLGRCCRRGRLRLLALLFPPRPPRSSEQKCVEKWSHVPFSSARAGAPGTTASPMMDANVQWTPLRRLQATKVARIPKMPTRAAAPLRRATVRPRCRRWIAARLPLSADVFAVMMGAAHSPRCLSMSRRNTECVHEAGDRYGGNPIGVSGDGRAADA
jgi:hypothetical protein